MHLLKYIILFTLLVIFASCKPAGPLTPEDAMSEFQGYYKDIDTKNLIGIIPEEDKVKLQKGLQIINEMNPETKSAFAENYDINPDRITGLTEEEYLYILIKVIKDKNPELFSQITESTILSMNEQPDNAEVILSSKIRVNLKKSGPYWKVYIPGL